MRSAITLSIILPLTLLNASALYFQNAGEKSLGFAETLYNILNISGWDDGLNSAASTVLEVLDSVFTALFSSDLLFGLTVALQIVVVAILASSFFGFVKNERSRGKDMLQEDYEIGSDTKPSEIFYIKEV